MEFYIGLICVLLFELFRFWVDKATKKQQNKLSNILCNILDKKIDNFTAEYKLISFNATSAIGVDNVRHKVAFLRYISVSHTCKLILVDFSKIIGIELTQDSKSIYSTSRSSQATGALVGGALMGGVGAIIGGLSGAKKQNKKTSKIELRINIDDIQYPLIRIILLEGRLFHSEYEQNSTEYKDAIRKANLWIARMNAVMQSNTPRTKKNKTIIKYIEEDKDNLQ